MSIHFKYDKLITIEVEDFADATVKPPVFSFWPTNSCRNLLKRFGLVFNRIENGFTIYYKIDKTRPAGDQFVSEIRKEQAFIFRFQLDKPQLASEFKQSLELNNVKQFYLNNLDNNAIKVSGKELHLDPSLGQKDKIELSATPQSGELGWYSGKRATDADSRVFDLKTTALNSDPYGILELRIKESQKTFNQIEYKIKLQA